VCTLELRDLDDKKVETMYARILKGSDGDGAQ
jgi:hypothetical protein